MPTVTERLATLEAIARENREKIDGILDQISGDGDVPYDRSVRGRLHQIETTLAGMVLRRNLGLGFLKGWERGALALCAVATVAASWYAALAH